MDKMLITVEGYAALEKELKTLKSTERPNVIRAIAEAREHGDLSENAEYHAARERQGFIEGRINELEGIISCAEVIDISTLSGDIVRFGATVVVYDEDTEAEETYCIVGTPESNIESKKISISSPLARALLGKTIGDVVEVSTPGGRRSLEVCNVRYGT